MYQTLIVAVAGIIVVAALASTTLIPPLEETDFVDMHLITSDPLNVRLGDELTVAVEVESEIATNVYSGKIVFDDNIIRVKEIKYDYGLADLWAVEPWYQAGDGTIQFAGGTTRANGFTGIQTLLTVTFKTITVGDSRLTLENGRVLLHDGSGTDAEIQTMVDLVLHVEPEITTDDKSKTQTLRTDIETKNSLVLIRPAAAPSLDLDNDGDVGVADLSIFFLHFSSQNTRSDFNVDGSVNISDLGMILSAI